MNCSNSIKVKYPVSQILTSSIIGFVPSVSSIIVDTLDNYNLGDSTVVIANSANWNSVYNSVTVNSASWNDVNSEINLGDFIFNTNVLSVSSDNDIYVYPKQGYSTNIGGTTFAQLQWVPLISAINPYGGFPTNWIYVDNAGTHIENVVLSSLTYTWYFSTDGKTYFPNFNFPKEHGNINQVLVDDGTGNLVWTALSAISDLTDTFVKLSGDIMIGGLSAPSLSCSTLYVNASTIYFLDNNGHVINYLDNQDVINFRKNTLTLANSGNWQSVYNTVNATSAQWNIDLDNNEVNSFVNSNSAGIINVNSVVWTNSANWNSAANNFVNVSGDRMTGNLEIYNNANTSKITLFSNATDSKRLIAHYQTITGEGLFTKYTDYWGDWFFGIHPDESRFILSFGDVGSLDSNTFEFTNGGILKSYAFSTTTGYDSFAWDSVYNSVNANSSTWGTGGSGDANVNSFVYNNSATIINVDTIVQNNSSVWANTTNAQYDSVYTTVNSNSSNNWNYQGTDIKSLTGNWQNTYNTVNNNSATTWNYQGTDIKSLSSNWQDTYTSVNNNSSAWTNNVTTVQINSGNWQDAYDYYTANNYPITVDGNPDTIVIRDGDGGIIGADIHALRPSESNWTHRMTPGSINIENDTLFSYYIIKPQEVTTSNITINLIWPTISGILITDTMIAASASYWSYQGTDVKLLTSNWQNTYNTVNANSSTWGIGNTNVNSFVYNNSATIINVNSVVQDNSATTWNYQGTDIKELSSTWQNTYNTVNANSTIWANTTNAQYDSVYTTVNNNSATTWNYQGTDIKSLTSIWQNTYTDFSVQSTNNTSVYTTVNSNSGLWNANDLNVNSFVYTNSATIINVDTIVQNNSSVWANTTNAQYDSVYTTVNNNSAINWNYQGTDIKSLTGNWQNTYTNFASQSTNNTSVYTTINANSATWNSGGGGSGDANVNSFVYSNSATIINVDSVVVSNSATWSAGGFIDGYDSIFSNYTASVGDKLAVFTSSSAIQITLPSSPLSGDSVWLLDAQGYFQTNNCIIQSDKNIQGTSPPLYCDVNWTDLLLTYVGVSEGWRIFPRNISEVTGGSSGSSVDNNLLKTSFGIGINGNGYTILSGSKGYTTIPYDCTINSWNIISNTTSGYVNFDIKKCTYSTFPTTSSICGTQYPSLSASYKNTSASISSWSPRISAGDILEYIVTDTTLTDSAYLTIFATKSNG